VSGYDFSIYENEKTINFICTVNEDNTPHVSIFSSVLKYDDHSLMFGEYCRGLSKSNLRRNPKAAIFSLTPEGVFAAGTVTWKGSLRSGPEHELFNNIPRFRYNATYGYEFVHILAINSLSAPAQIDAAQVKEAVAGTKTAIDAVAPKPGNEVISHVGAQLFAPDETPKLAAYIKEDGYPHLIYVPQARLLDSGTIVIDASLNKGELLAIPGGAKVAVMAYVPRLGSSIEADGHTNEFCLGARDTVVVVIDRVYNGNTPKAGYIYPVPEIKEFRTFAGAMDV
jgi:hypothetical protein